MQAVKQKMNFPDLWKRVRKCRGLYLMFLPVLAYYIIFHYVPMYGIQIAFRDYVPTAGFFGSEWVGLKHFERFFDSYYFWRLLKNTIGISLYSLLVSTPMPIILAIMFHHISNSRLKKFFQGVSYIPHFISTVIIVTLITFFFGNTNGIINSVLEMAGMQPVKFLTSPGIFWHLYVWSGVWQNIGWGSIIYSASIAAIPEEQFEASYIDGANVFMRIWYIILPGILPTIIILLIMNVGQIMNIGFEKILLMQNDMNKETSDVISTYVYEIGILGGQHSFSTAIGLFNNIINFILIIIANTVSKKLVETSLW